MPRNSNSGQDCYITNELKLPFYAKELSLGVGLTFDAKKLEYESGLLFDAKKLHENAIY